MKVVNNKKKSRNQFYDSFLFIQDASMCIYIIGNIDTSLYFFYFLMLNITPKTTPRNAANNTW